MACVISADRWLADLAEWYGFIYYIGSILAPQIFIYPNIYKYFKTRLSYEMLDATW